MAFRSKEEENYTINNSLEEVRLSIINALDEGGFTSIAENKMINQITANYRKFTVWGNITITIEESGKGTKVQTVAVANADNIYALFSSPTRRILNKFKENLK